MISIEIPFPIPLSVIFSPNHIQKTVPAVSMIMEDIRKKNPFKTMASADMVVK